MAFRTVYTPLYRDADESGRVGTLGLLAMLQESVLGHAAALGLDHDDLVRTRGIGEDVFLEMEALMASASDVSRELEAVKASSMPYAKAHARVESL